MKTNTLTTGSVVGLPILLGAIIAVIAYSVYANKSLPLIGSPRAALVVMLVLGMTMCTAGIGQVAASGRWASPLAIAGYLLGAALLVILIGGLAGWKMPLITGPRDAVLAAGGLIGVKFLIGTAGYFLRLL